ncbi:diguanylate cyclase [Turicibacter sp. MMM721]|uniref:Diguanylate cyclase n=1 Tax=Turicibacter bilis TaxID=2735723 RepID=A0ABY5JN18_9FIRM|nr:diguanylate cyclase [Turicibacter bilis]UUF07256.1 diguanylate cyclase [Turicibacter bilis]
MWHQAGDEVLQQVGNLLNKYKNKTMLVGRYGGEEFIIFLAD